MRNESDLQVCEARTLLLLPAIAVLTIPKHGPETRISYIISGQQGREVATCLSIRVPEYKHLNPRWPLTFSDG